MDPKRYPTLLKIFEISCFSKLCRLALKVFLCIQEKFRFLIIFSHYVIMTSSLRNRWMSHNINQYWHWIRTFKFWHSCLTFNSNLSFKHSVLTFKFWYSNSDIQFWHSNQKFYVWHYNSDIFLVFFMNQPF